MPGDMTYLATALDSIGASRQGNRIVSEQTIWIDGGTIVSCDEHGTDVDIELLDDRRWNRPSSSMLSFAYDMSESYVMVSCVIYAIGTSRADDELIRVEDGRLIDEPSASDDIDELGLRGHRHKVETEISEGIRPPIPKYVVHDTNITYGKCDDVTSRLFCAQSIS